MPNSNDGVRGQAPNVRHYVGFVDLGTDDISVSSGHLSVYVWSSACLSLRDRVTMFPYAENRMPGKILLVFKKVHLCMQKQIRNIQYSETC